MNKSNIKYSSINFIFKDAKDINYLNELKINFNNVKSLTIKKEKNSIINFSIIMKIGFFPLKNLGILIIMAIF